MGCGRAREPPCTKRAGLYGTDKIIGGGWHHSHLITLLHGFQSGTERGKEPLNYGFEKTLNVRYTYVESDIF